MSERTFSLEYMAEYSPDVALEALKGFLCEDRPGFDKLFFYKNAWHSIAADFCLQMGQWTQSSCQV